MTTIEETLKDRLVGNGVFPDMAEKIMAIVKADDINKAMQGRWNEPPETYPSSVLAILWVSTKHTALEWIIENCPNAWFRPMFEKGSQ